MQREVKAKKTLFDFRQRRDAQRAPRHPVSPRACKTAFSENLNYENFVIQMQSRF